MHIKSIKDLWLFFRRSLQATLSNPVWSQPLAWLSVPLLLLLLPLLLLALLLLFIVRCWWIIVVVVAVVRSCCCCVSKVDKSYIEDGFNLYGLRNQVPHFLESMEIILDRLGAWMLLLCRSKDPMHPPHPSLTHTAHGNFHWETTAHTPFTVAIKFGCHASWTEAHLTTSWFDNKIIIIWPIKIRLATWQNFTESLATWQQNVFNSQETVATINKIDCQSAINLFTSSTCFRGSIR